MKRLVLIGIMAIVMSVLAAPAFAGVILVDGSIDAVMEVPGKILYNGTVTVTGTSAYDAYLMAYEYNSGTVNQEAFPGNITDSVPLVINGTFNWEGLIPSRIVVHLYTYDPSTLIAMNKDKSIFHYVNWLISGSASVAEAGWAHPPLNWSTNTWTDDIFIDSPIVDAGVTELDFTLSAADQPIIISNDGRDDLTITDVSTPDAPFSMVEDCTTGGGVIAAGGTCTITVSFDDGVASLKSNNALYASLGSGILLLGIGLAFAPKGSKSTIVIMLLAVTLSIGVLQACGSDDSKDYTIRITSDDPNGVTKIKLIK